MLAAMGVHVEAFGNDALIQPASNPLAPVTMRVPGDLSSAAFLLVAALLVPASAVVVDSVGVNPTRTGLLDVLSLMGSQVNVEAAPEQGGEPVGDVSVHSSPLRGVEIGGDTVVRMIDEFPILAVAATQAEGTTLVRDAAELRVKETDRIATVVAELRKLGARIEPLPDGFVVEGPTPLNGGVVASHGDHRLGMALAVAGLVAQDEIMIEDAACISDSFPGFVDVMRTLGAPMRLA
jgi:3-phosphoshikimate 1-carboxyvinyltransferase